MASIPLPALDIKPAQPPDMLGDVSKLMALRNMMNQGQAQQQEMQLRQQQLQDQQATTSAMKATNPLDPKYKNDSDSYYSDLSQAVLGHGGSANAATAIQQHGLTIKKTVSDIAKQDADTGSKKLETFISAHKYIGDALEGIENVPDEQLHAKALATVQDFTKNGIMDPATGQQLAQQIQATQDPKVLRDQIDVFAKSSLGAKAAAEQAKTVAETNKATAETSAATELATQRRAESAYYAAHGGAQGVPVDRVQMDAWLANNQGKTPADYPGAKAAAVATAEEPSKTRLAKAEAEARQQAAQGDPSVAGQMLAKGDLTLADLKSRGTTPQFITSAVAAAQKVNTTYNPADEVIAESVAKSPAANQFFGSANSLITKGGTLDQLAKLAKNVPQHDWPVLNTVDDWQELARGKGPLAGYAATALGVADDYGKVMGGGNASDHARDAALALFAKAASPEQRAQAIAATRNAVQSQRDSRIGSNQFLKRQYGVEVSSGEQGGGQQSSGHKVGDLIVQNGQTFKATKVDANGKVTAADPQ